MTLQQAIQNNPHDSKEYTYIPGLVATYGVDEIIQKIEEMLQGPDDQKMDALLFLRDASLHGPNVPIHNQAVDSLRKAISKSNIFPLMDDLLYSDNDAVRYQAVYTFGKMTFREQAFRLLNAIDVYAQKYPDQLASVLFEYTWLTETKDLDLLQKLQNLNNPAIQDAVKGFLEMSYI